MDGVAVWERDLRFGGGRVPEVRPRCPLILSDKRSMSFGIRSILSASDHTSHASALSASASDHTSHSTAHNSPTPKDRRFPVICHAVRSYFRTSDQSIWFAAQYSRQAIILPPRPLYQPPHPIILPIQPLITLLLQKTDASL